MPPPATKHKRGQPFLRRSWTTSVTKNSADSPPKTARRPTTNDDARDGGFKAKSGGQPSTPVSGMRLRQTERLPLGAEKPSVVRPTRRRPVDSKAGPQSLRINLREIVHGTLRHRRVGASSPGAHNAERTRALCTVTITCSPDPHQSPIVRHRESQFCAFDVFPSPNSQHRMASIALTRPFLIVRESILVNRENGLEFADSYELVIEFEAGEGPWPLFKPADFGIAAGRGGAFASPSRKWVLRARVADVFKKPRNFIKMSLAQHNPETHHGTDHYLIVDITWASPASPAVDAESPTQAGLRQPSEDQVAAAASKEQENDDAHTPAAAASKDEEDAALDASSTRISYQFPSLLVALDAFSCAVCGYTHATKVHLQAHLQMNHEQFEFEMRDTPAKGLVCTVRHRTDDDPTMSRRLFSLVDADKSFKLDQIANGDLTSVAKVGAAVVAQLSKPKSSQYYPSLIRARDILKTKAHLSWLHQADAESDDGCDDGSDSGNDAGNDAVPSTLADQWDEWCTTHSFPSPISLQYEFTCFVRSSFSSFAESDRLRDALRSSVRFLVDKKAMDAPYSSAVLDLVEKAEGKKAQGKKAQGKKSRYTGADHHDSGVEEIERTGPGPVRKLVALPWKPPPHPETSNSTSGNGNAIVVPSDSEGEKPSSPTCTPRVGTPRIGTPRIETPPNNTPALARRTKPPQQTTNQADEDGASSLTAKTNSPTPSRKDTTAKDTATPKSTPLARFRSPRPVRSTRSNKSYNIDPLKMILDPEDNDGLAVSAPAPAPASATRTKRAHTALDEPAEPPVPRTPAATAAATPTSATTPTTPATGDPPVKRRRGRPPKNPAALAAPEQPTAVMWKKTPKLPAAGSGPAGGG